MFRKRAVLAIIVSVIVAGSATFGTVMYSQNRQYRNFLQAQYERSLYNLIADVENMQVSLSKATVTASPKQSLLLFDEIARDARDAQEKITSLPLPYTAINETTKFLSQVGDFSYSLLKQTNRGEGISETQWDNVQKLKDFAGYLNVQLQELQTDVSEGTISIGEIALEGRRLFQRNLQDTADLRFQNISSEIQQYPTLIYDGPFAENVLNIKPKVLSEKEISLENAKDIAAKIIGKDKVEGIKQYSNKSGSTVPVYALSVDVKGRDNGDINIDISKNGGYVVYMLDSRDVGEAKISIKEAINQGMKFLDKNGYKDMMPTYSLRYDNTAVINYVYVKDKVVIYPDQIKLKIALDKGDIVGIESQHYLTAHIKNRNIPKPRITVDEARKNVSQKLDIKNVRLTIIPMESQREVFCYEFYGIYNGEKYLIYINALDGSEERILKILETPNGELTM